MIQQMTQRERTLAMLVGGILFVFVNLFLVKYFVNQHRQLRADLRDLNGKAVTTKKRPTGGRARRASTSRTISWTMKSRSVPIVAIPFEHQA